jgi:P27 family predicted phage terminase small subunit
MRGRRPIPLDLKLLTGNPGKRPLNRREPKGIPGVPACPRHLSRMARDAWHRIGQRLKALKVVTDADAEALELACSAYAEYRAARAVIARRGATYVSRTLHGVLVRKRPEVEIAADAWRRLRLMLVEFGMTPSARTRLATAEPGAGGEAAATDEFLFGSHA